MPSIQAVPAVPAMRVITTGGPQSAAVLCITPAQPDSVSKCITNPSSADIDRSPTCASDALTPAISPSVTRS